MVNEFDIKAVKPKGGDTVIRSTKPLVVKDVRGSLAVGAESTDWATLARAVEYCVGTGIRPDLPYIHVAEGHGYLLEELDPQNVSYLQAEGQPVEDIRISEDAIVSYNIERDSRPQLTGEVEGGMVVATRAQGLNTYHQPTEEVVNLNIALREKEPSVIDEDTQVVQEAWFRSLLASVKK